MAEPARQKHPEIEPEIRPRLGVIQGGGESTPERGNLSSVNPAPGLKEREEKLEVIQGGGESTDDRADLRAVAADQEDNPLNYVPSSNEKAPQSFGKRASLFVRKRAASLTITAILGVFGIGASFFSGSALLLVHVKEVLTNYGSSASRAADSRFENSLYYRLTGGTEAACRKSGAISTVKCRRGTMSEKNHQKLKDSGFKVDSKNVGGRYVITSVSKDGVSLNGKSSRANIKAAMAHPDFGSSMRRTMNWRTGVFNGSRFGSKVLAAFGLDKTKVEAKGDTDEERKKSVNQLTGAADEDTDEKRRTKFEGKYGSKIKGVAKIGTNPAAAAGGVICSGYNMTRAGLVAVKLYNAARFASLAILFLKAADQIKANGEIDPATVALLGGVLTSYHTTGKMKGLTATDSQGFKVAAYGGEGALKSFSRKFLLGGNEKLIELDQTINSINDNTPGGKKTIKTSCGTITDPVLGAATTIAMCGGVGGGSGFLAGTVVPVIGNAIGGATGTAAGIGVCAAIGIGAILGTSAMLGAIFKYILPRVVDYLTDAPIDVNKIKGVEAGDAIAAGAGVILGKSNASRGMQPGTKASVTAFQSDTAEDQKSYDMIAKYEAQKEPLNIYNEYSLLGSLVRKSGLVNLGNGSFASNMSTLSNALFSPARLSTVASADSSMPINITAEDLSHCPDQDLKDIGVDCDVVGGTPYTMATDIPVADNLTFMEGIHADETGEPISEEYKKWVANCTEQRTDPMGSTSVGIEVEDEWATGEACVAGSSAKINQTTRDHFSTYYYDNGAQEDEDYEPSEAIASTNTTGDLNVGSYNIRTSTLNNRDFGDPNSEYDAKDEARMRGAAGIITSRQLQIVGVQEVRKPEQKGLMDNLPNYAGTPVMNAEHELESTVLWDKSAFEQVGSEFGTYTIPKNPGIMREGMWVKLRSLSTGGEVYVFNMHTSSKVESMRATAARTLLAEINNVVGSSGTPVIVMGDMNSNDKQPGRRAVYDIFKASGILTYTRDATTVREGMNCDTENGPEDGKQDCRRGVGSHIDQIWISKNSDMTINSWENIATEETLKYSDHNPVIVNLTAPSLITPAGVGEVGADGWAWPLAADESKAGPCYGTGDPGDEHAGLDINSDGDGEVYAMHDGVVVTIIDGKTGSSPATGNHIMIKTPEGIYYGYQHLKAGGMKVSVNDTVKAGQHIATGGKTGNVQASSKIHLHVTMAKSNTTGSYGNLGDTFDPMSVLRSVKPASYECTGATPT